MTGWCIVAIPSETDYVWKLSSEKVPHMTLLFLGEQDGNPNEVRMAEFVQHVADTTLLRFGLQVDYRGLLGSEDADVLYFNDSEHNHALNKIKALRTTLLQDQNIFEAYSSVDQFPNWTPHLTLGYPATPAKPDDRDYPGIYWVNFDRLALWTMDSDGYEFLLKEQEELAMSDIPVSELAHYGVPGMKWGKRSGGLGARVKGAALDRNQRATAKNQRVAEGRGSLRDKAYVLNRTSATSLLMNKGLKGVATKRVSALKDQKARIELGKTTLRDKLTTALTTSTTDLLVSRTDNRG